MIFVLSPAKSLDYETPAPPDLPASTPLFTSSARVLINQLRRQSPAQIAQLMHLSDSLAALNVARYAAWRAHANNKNAKQAVLAFDGDVYEGLNAKTLSTPQLLWAQDHVLSLSGLYGVLRPLDLLQPYRLEMGTLLPNPKGKNLYEFWRETINDYVHQRLKKDHTPILVNLASQEYFKVIQPSRLKARVLECVFEDYKNGGYQVISFFAKRARGWMARFAIENQITHASQLQEFQREGYSFNAQASSADRLVFRRKAP